MKNIWQEREKALENQYIYEQEKKKRLFDVSSGLRV
jgi:hypothetical protein